MECTSLRDDMMDVLYGEASEDRARAVADHCLGCPTCREEMRAFKSLRHDLAAWDLREGKGPSRSRFGRRPFQMAAAAALLLATGCAAGLALAEVRLQRLLDAREARFQQEIATVRAEAAKVPSRDDAALLAQVDERMRRMETRQAALLDTRLAGFADRTEAQRRYDLARMSAGLSYLDGRTGQSMARATELMGYVLQASEKR